jgi:hypothetical protein
MALLCILQINKDAKFSISQVTWKLLESWLIVVLVWILQQKKIVHLSGPCTGSSRAVDSWR